MGSLRQAQRVPEGFCPWPEGTSCCILSEKTGPLGACSLASGGPSPGPTVPGSPTTGEDKSGRL